MTKVVECAMCGSKMPKPPKHAQEKYRIAFGYENVCKNCRKSMEEVNKTEKMGTTKIPVEENKEDDSGRD